MKFKTSLSIFLFTALLPVCGLSQQAWWTWLHGTAGAAPGNWGTQGVPAASNEPPSMYKTDACWSDSHGDFWFYGGELQHSALWKYSPPTNMWTWVKGSNVPGQPPVFGTKGVAAPGNNPPYMALGGMTWTDAQDNLWLFGGQNSTYADLWKYDPVTNMWTWMHGPGAPAAGNYGVQGVSSPTNLPPPRYETTATWVDNNGKFWLFGGWDNLGGQLNDMWKYDPLTNEWTWMKGSNTGNSPGNYGVKGVAAATNNPPARWIYSRWKDNSGNLWMFGGTHYSNTQSMNDMWKFDPSTNNWTWMSGSNIIDDQPATPQKCIPSTTNYPKSRYENHVSWKDKCGNFWLFSGEWIPTLGVQNNSDIWCYKVATNEWVFVGGNTTPSHGTKGVPAGSNFPGDVFGAGAFTYNDQFYFFGGRGNGGGNLVWQYTPDSSCAKSFCSPQTPNPWANFNADSLIGCAPLTVYFTNTSTNASIWTWNFGDGSPTSGAQNPVHTYTNPGNYTVSLIASNGTTSDTLTYVNYVNVIAPAVASYSFVPNDTVCVGQSVTVLNTSTNATSYQWNSAFFKDTTTNLIYTFPVGTHTIYFFAYNPFGCNDADTFNIVVLNGFASTQSVSICSGTNYTLPGGAVVTAPGTYVDTLGAGGPCDTIITTFLAVTPPFSSSYSVSICNGDSVLLPGGNYATAAGTYIDSLSTVSGCDSIVSTVVSAGNSVTSMQNPVICSGNIYTLPGGNTVTVSGTYTDTIPSAGGCDSIITTNLSVNPSASSAQNPIVCSGIPFVLPGGSSVSTSGIYSDTLTAANGCDSIVTTNLTVNPSPNASVSANVTITYGSTTTLSASGGGNYSWSPAAGLNSTTDSTVFSTPGASTFYCVTVTNSSGCSDSACVSVSVEIICGTFYLPNAFSPNGDGEDDTFHAYIHPTCVQEFKLIIYNRWGEKVFQSEDVTQGWDGQFRGTMSNPAVYSYYCHAVLTSGKEIEQKGNVSLMR